MKKLVCVLMVLFSQPASADPFFTGNPWSPIPPGCITRPDLQYELYGNHQVVFVDRIANLRVADRPGGWYDFNDLGPVNTLIRRVGCAEPGRSVLFVDHWLPNNVDYDHSRFLVPNYLWDPDSTGGTLGWLAPAGELNSGVLGQQPGGAFQATFGDYTDGWLDARYFVWTYFLDSPGPLAGYPVGPISAERYNETLRLVTDHHVAMEPIPAWVAPATRDLDLGIVPMPLNGRHSGTWVIEGARDQGISLSFSNRIPPAGQAVPEPERSLVFLFLAWYTFDAEGRIIWLTGSGEFEQGAQSVDLEFVLVTGGEFLGSARANRTPAGTATLSARSCADLALDFDLSTLGLGAGSVRLARVHELEIAGYNCRDHDARRVASYGAGTTETADESP